MNAATIVSIMKPNITSLGYGLFLAINAAGVWGGVFPFLPMEFQTTEIVFWFFLAQSLVFSFSYFASALGSYFFPGPTRTFIVRLATMPYLLGWCCLIAAIYLDAWALPLVVSGGALLVDLLGVGQDVAAVLLQGGSGLHDLVLHAQDSGGALGIQLLRILAGQNLNTGGAKQSAACKQTNLCPIHSSNPLYCNMLAMVYKMCPIGRTYKVYSLFYNG